jgi:hypothetical protein
MVRDGERCPTANHQTIQLAALHSILKDIWSDRERSSTPEQSSLESYRDLDAAQVLLGSPRQDLRLL